MDPDGEQLAELSDSSLGSERVTEVDKPSSQDLSITGAAPVLIESERAASDENENADNKPENSMENYVESLNVNSLSPWNPTATHEDGSTAENIAKDDASRRKRSKHSRSHSHGKDKKHHRKKKKKDGHEETTESGKSHKKRRKSKHQHEKQEHKPLEETDIKAFLVKPKYIENEHNDSDNDIKTETITSPVAVVIHDTSIDAAKGDKSNKQRERRYDVDLDMSRFETNVALPETDMLDTLCKTSNISDENRQRRHSTNSKSSLSESGKRSRERSHGKRRHGSKSDRHGSHSPHRHRRSRSKSIQRRDTDRTILNNEHRHEETESIRHRKRHHRHTSDDHHRARKSSKDSTTPKSLSQSIETDQFSSSHSKSQSKKLRKKKREKHEKDKERLRRKKISENLKKELDTQQVVSEQPKLDVISDNNEDMEIMEDAFNSMEAVHSLNITSPPMVNILETISDESISPRHNMPLIKTLSVASPDALNVPLATMDYDLIPVSPNKSSPELIIDTDNDSIGDIPVDITPPAEAEPVTVTKLEGHYASFISPEPTIAITGKQEQTIPHTEPVAAEESVKQASDTKDDLFEDIFGNGEDIKTTTKDEFASLISTTTSSFVYSPSHPTSLPSSPKQEVKTIAKESTSIQSLPDKPPPIHVSLPKVKEKLPFMMDSDDEDDIEYQLEKSAEQKRKALLEVQIARERDTTIPLLFDSKPIEVPVVVETSRIEPKLPLIQEQDVEEELIFSPESGDGFEIPLLDMNEKDDVTSLEPFQEIMRRKLEQQARRDKKIELENEKKTKVTKEHKLVNFLVRQAKVEEEMKTHLKAYYRKKEITKEEYKGILKKAVPQVTMSQSQVIPEKIESLMKKYVCKVKGQRKKYGKATFLY